VVEAHGGQIRIEAEVTDVLMKDRTVRGVVLANGEEILAPAVLSDLDVKRSFLGLFQWKDLPEGLVESIGRFRMKGVVAKVNLALDGAPEFPALAAGCPAVAGGLRLAGSVERMEEAFDDWRDGIPPRDPLIEVLMPSLSDPTLAPAGKHVLSAVVQYVPETLHEGAWCAERRNALGDLVVSRLAEVSPDIGARIVAREIWLPADIEAEIGLTSGDFSHGEMTLDQMFFNRPLAGMGGYDTPVRNFYLCSESAHPGAMVPARSGANAAARVLAARKGRG
jgi:phytoene dehydrogenase-like protein